MQFVPELYEYIVTYSAHGIVILDRDGSVRFANPAAESLLDRPPGALVGHPLGFELVPGEATVFEVARPGGGVISVELRAKSLYWDDEPGVLVYLRDITSDEQASQALRRRDAILEAVSFAAEQFLQSADWKTCIHSVLERLGHAMGASRAHIFENGFDSGGARTMSQRFEWVAPGITPQIENPHLQNFSWQTGGFGDWEAQLRQGHVARGYTREFSSGLQDELGAEDIQAILIVPIFVGQDWWGFIGFDECLFEREWSAAEADALRAAAGTLGAAIQRERAEAELRAQKQWFENLVAVARATTERPTLQDTLRNALQVALALTGASGGDLCLLSRSGIVTDYLLPPGLRESGGRSDTIANILSKGLAGWVARHREPALVVDTRDDDRWLILPDDPYHARSALSVPIMSGAALLGILTLAHTEPNHFSAEHLRLMQAAADQMALALRNAQMFDEQRRMADRQKMLYEVLSAVGGQLDPDGVARVAVDAIMRVTWWPNVALAVPGEDGASWRLVAVSGRLSGPLGLCRPIGQGIIGRAFRTGQTQLVPDVTADPDYIVGHAEVRSELAAPLRREGRVLGALNIESDQRDAFSADDVLQADSLAEAIALALDNARLFQATQDERGRLQALIKASRDGVVLIGMNGRILVINASVLELIHLPGQPEDYWGMPLKRLLPALRKQPDAFRIMLSEARRVRTGAEPPGEGDCEWPPRTFHWLNLPVLSGDVTVGRLLVLHDVTAERAIDRMREDMISMMVHDLRNPVGAAYTAVELLRSDEVGELGPDQREVVAIVERSLNRVQGLINNILSLRELESGQVPIRHAEIHLSVLVDETLRAQASLAAARQVHLENQVPSGLPAAWADVDLIGRVLQNLLDNAVKFSPVGGWVRVTAKTAREGARTAIWVSVSDSGPGIPSSIRGQLFQKFVTGRQKGRGSGLGLAFCKLALEAHGERIWAESVPERGTTFTFSLPVSEGTGPT